MTIRTDLAEEARGLWNREGKPLSAIAGVRSKSWQQQGIERRQVQILSREGEKTLGKPRGTYDSLRTGADSRPTPELESQLTELLTHHLALGPEDSVLVVCLGNRDMTPDAIGPLTAGKLLVTRHLKVHMPELFSTCRSVACLCPGVMGNTGLESARTVAGLVRDLKPDRVLVVDALAAGEPQRLCRVIQVTDAGIVPGSGVDNSRQSLSREMLGVPVVAVGAATVMDGGTREAPLTVTHRDIDARVQRLTDLISRAINRALNPELAEQEGLLG